MTDTRTDDELVALVKGVMAHPSCESCRADVDCHDESDEACTAALTELHRRLTEKEAMCEWLWRELYGTAFILDAAREAVKERDRAK